MKLTLKNTYVLELELSKTNKKIKGEKSKLKPKKTLKRTKNGKTKRKRKKNKR